LEVAQENDSMTNAPIALFVYNRPAHTRQLIDSLLRNEGVADSALYVFSDAPRNNAAIDPVAEVRSYIHSIKGFKSVEIIERDNNAGLARSIIDGVTYLCNEYGRVIVLEDDLLVSQWFLAYMNNAISLYKDDDRVMQIAGYMFPASLELEDDALFLPFISSWGWATWSRAWQHFDPEAKAYEKLSRDSELKNRFDLNGNYSYFKMLRAQQEGKADSWAIRWYLSVFMRDGLALYPIKSMVRNQGFDGSGVNCAISNIEEAALDIGFRPVSFPTKIEITEFESEVLTNMPVPSLSLSSVFNRLSGYMKRILPF
jgi:hypothetical protein